MDAARRALTRNRGSEWARASGAHRAKYLRAIAAKVIQSRLLLWCFGLKEGSRGSLLLIVLDRVRDMVVFILINYELVQLLDFSS